MAWPASMVDGFLLAAVVREERAFDAVAARTTHAAVLGTARARLDGGGGAERRDRLAALVAAHAAVAGVSPRDPLRGRAHVIAFPRAAAPATPFGEAPWPRRGFTPAPALRAFLRAWLADAPTDPATAEAEELASAPHGPSAPPAAEGASGGTHVEDGLAALAERLAAQAESHGAPPRRVLGAVRLGARGARGGDGASARWRRAARELAELGESPWDA